MGFEVDFSPDSQTHLRAIRKADQARIIAATEVQLGNEPMTPTRNRKPMRSNLLATWELRVGNFRVYYDVNELERTVLVRAIGIKHHAKVSIGGKELDLS